MCSIDILTYKFAGFPSNRGFSPNSYFRSISPIESPRIVTSRLTGAAKYSLQELNLVPCVLKPYSYFERCFFYVCRCKSNLARIYSAAFIANSFVIDLIAPKTS